jgi:hypothetical protein
VHFRRCCVPSPVRKQAHESDDGADRKQRQSLKPQREEPWSQRSRAALFVVIGAFYLLGIVQSWQTADDRAGTSIEIEASPSNAGS